MFVVIVVVSASFSALCFLSYLAFLAYVIRKTGDTEGLRDVAIAIRAFRFPFRAEKEPQRVSGRSAPDSGPPGENCRRCT